MYTSPDKFETLQMNNLVVWIATIIHYNEYYISSNELWCINMSNTFNSSDLKTYIWLTQIPPPSRKCSEILTKKCAIWRHFIPSLIQFFPFSLSPPYFFLILNFFIFPLTAIPQHSILCHINPWITLYCWLSKEATLLLCLGGFVDNSRPLNLSRGTRYVIKLFLFWFMAKIRGWKKTVFISILSI